MKKTATIASLLILVLVGGIMTVRSLVKSRSSDNTAATKAGRTKAHGFRATSTGITNIDSRNAVTPERAAEAVRETLRTNPELLSTTAALPPFDLADFEANPKEYLNQVVPARALQTAMPGPGVPALEVQSEARTAIATGEVAPLWVKGVPGGPVTFTTFDGGIFKETGLTSATVQANANGLAVAHYTAGPGIGGDVNIVAGSPLTTGTRRFLIRVGGTVAVAERNDK